MNRRRGQRDSRQPKYTCVTTRPSVEPPPTLAVDETDGPHPAILRLCDLIRAIPRGRVCTYGHLAAGIGWPRHARLVGRFLAESPLAAALPWHRVVGAGGMIRPRSCNGADEQRARLLAEHTHVSPSGRVDLNRHGWTPDGAPKPSVAVQPGGLSR